MPKKTFQAAAAANAHLIVQLKDNQPTLYQSIKVACAGAKILSGVQSVDEKRRNRHETRTVGVFRPKAAVAETEWEPHVAAVIQVERRVLTFQPKTGLWKESDETSFYLSNRPINADLAVSAIREHWGIENRSHYVRDVTLREDASRIRKNPGVFARIRSYAYNILRANQVDSVAHDRYALALGGIDALRALNYGKER